MKKLFVVMMAVLALCATANVFAEEAAVAAGDDFKIKGDPVAGEAIYKMYCFVCHGDTGKGDGVTAATLDPKPRNFTDKEVMAKISDKEVFTAIKDGGPAVGKSPLMIAWGPLLQDDQKVHDVAAFVRKFAE